MEYDDLLELILWLTNVLLLGLGAYLLVGGGLIFVEHETAWSYPIIASGAVVFGLALFGMAGTYEWNNALYLYFIAQLVMNLYAVCFAVLGNQYLPAAMRAFWDNFDVLYREKIAKTNLVKQAEMDAWLQSNVNHAMMVAVALAVLMSVGSFCAGQMLGFKRIVKRSMRTLSGSLMALGVWACGGAIWLSYRVLPAMLDWLIPTLAVTSAFTFLIGVMGCFAVKRETKKMLKIYTVLMLAMTICLGGGLYSLKDYLDQPTWKEQARSEAESFVQENKQDMAALGASNQTNFEEMIAQVDAYTFPLLVLGSLVVDLLIVSVCGAMYLTNNRKENEMEAEFVDVLGG